MNHSSTFRSRLPLVAVVAAVGLFGLTACAGAAATTTPDDTASEAETAEQPPAGADQARGVSGLVAAASDGLLQVQSTSSDGESEQTAVTYTGETTVTSEITGSLADVTVGSCVTIMTGTEDDAVATTVRITAAVDGACTTGFGGGGMGGGPGGDRPEGAPTGAPTDGERPEGAPTDAPEGMGDGGFGGITAGLVTAVDGTTITVESTVPDEEEATTTTVTVDDATTYTTTVDADATALAAGVCVTAQGEADESGGFAATSLAVSAAVDGACSTGFGGGRGMGPGEATS